MGFQMLAGAPSNSECQRRSMSGQYSPAIDPRKPTVSSSVGTGNWMIFGTRFRYPSKVHDPAVNRSGESVIAQSILRD